MLHGVERPHWLVQHDPGGSRESGCPQKGDTSMTQLGDRLAHRLRQHGAPDDVCDCLELGDWSVLGSAMWRVEDGERVLDVQDESEEGDPIWHIVVHPDPDEIEQHFIVDSSGVHSRGD